MDKYKSIDPNQLSIADGMIDWVRVVSKDNMVLYANKKMQEDLGENIVGKKCWPHLRQQSIPICLYYFFAQFQQFLQSSLVSFKVEISN